MFIGCSTNGFYPQLGVADALVEIGTLGFTHAELMLHHLHQYAPRVLSTLRTIRPDSGVIIEVIHLKPDLHQAFDPDPATQGTRGAISMAPLPGPWRLKPDHRLAGSTA